MLIHWIVIYPVDSAIQLLNNWGQAYCGDKATSNSQLLQPLCFGLNESLGYPSQYFEGCWWPG